MSRPRAGYARTYTLLANGTKVEFLHDAMGVVISTGEACGWPRCCRCRKPERKQDLIRGLCWSCYFYKTGHGANWFWEQKEHRLFPYTIGKRISESITRLNSYRECANAKDLLRKLNSANARPPEA
jgi:hypothetical protein